MPKDLSDCVRLSMSPRLWHYAMAFFRNAQKMVFKKANISISKRAGTNSCHVTKRIKKLVFTFCKTQSKATSLLHFCQLGTRNALEAKRKIDFEATRDLTLSIRETNISVEISNYFQHKYNAKTAIL